MAKDHFFDDNGSSEFGHYTTLNFDLLDMKGKPVDPDFKLHKLLAKNYVTPKLYLATTDATLRRANCQLANCFVVLPVEEKIMSDLLTSKEKIILSRKIEFPFFVQKVNISLGTVLVH